ncbi:MULTISPECIES: phosphopantetheine-binding protein [Streptomyces]|uniref:phosphopantetheine-binding protein n=1 Tax=Streptomyces TaxID=1883 RepID=UPI0006EB573D|nr:MULTISPECIES: phosphopantetheine-binding protein [Streptomyces]MCF3123119.1 phosphopantetheine-binding protein [Streptomyces arenae]
MDTDVPRSADEIRAAAAALIGMAAADIPDDANLVRLGLTSLDVMRLSGRWRRGGIVAQFETLVADPTISGWARHIGSLTADDTSGS